MFFQRHLVFQYFHTHFLYLFWQFLLIFFFINNFVFDNSWLIVGAKRCAPKRWYSSEFNLKLISINKSLDINHIFLPVCPIIYRFYKQKNLFFPPNFTKFYQFHQFFSLFLSNDIWKFVGVNLACRFITVLMTGQN